jgi:hypothetical protein
MMPTMGMGMMPMMCRMTMEMTKDGMTMKCMPMDGMPAEMFKERCEAMSRMMMSGGMPCMMMCGGMTMMCVPATK